jgi:ElaA protein
VVTWRIVPYRDLTKEDVYSLLALRQCVFIVEQQCPYLDADGLDPHCEHVLGYDERGDLIACLRIVPPGLKYDEPSIGRVLTFGEGRGKGIGRELVTTGLDRLAALYPGQPVRISAQQYLERFYGDFGFITVSEPYDEDGIPHVVMMLRP